MCDPQELLPAGDRPGRKMLRLHDWETAEAIWCDADVIVSCYRNAAAEAYGGEIPEHTAVTMSGGDDHCRGSLHTTRSVKETPDEIAALAGWQAAEPPPPPPPPDRDTERRGDAEGKS